MTERKLFEARRELGKTGFIATRIGAGDLADRRLGLETCAATLRRAIDAGLNVVDTAPQYEDGFSEEVVGEAVKGLRDSLFIIDKIDDLESPGAPQIEASLARLQMDSADAFVFHNLSSMETFWRLMVPGGGFDQLKDAVRQGKARFRGISSHHPEVLRAAIETGVCDIVLFPVGPFVDRRYVEETLPLAKAKQIGTVCFKTFGAGKLLGDTPGYNQPLQMRPRGKFSSGGEEPDVPLLPRLGVRDCVHYSLTLDPDVALLGLSFPYEQDQAFEAARNFSPLDGRTMDAIRERAQAARKDKGPCWWNPAPEA